MKEPDLTIITCVYSAEDDFLKELARAVKNQKYSGKITHIFINNNTSRPRKIKGLYIINNEPNPGLAGALNKGFKLAKTKIVVSLMDDCLPSSNDWLKKLIEPFENKAVVASISRIELPKKIWSNFDVVSRILTAKEQRLISPGLDEKACAYKKSAIYQVGGFENKTFRTAGEDVITQYKIGKVGKIVNTEAKIFHYHFTNWKSRIRKEAQYNESLGTIIRKYPSAVSKRIRILSLVKYLLPFFLFFRKTLLLSLIFIVVLSNKDLNWVYKKFGFSLALFYSILIKFLIYPIQFMAFWRGFLSGKQRM